MRSQVTDKKKSDWLFSLTGKCVDRGNESWQNKKQSTISPVNKCDERHSRDLRPDPNLRPFNSERGAFYPLRYSATPTPRSHECFVQLVKDSFPPFSRNWQVNTLFNRPTERGKKEERKKRKDEQSETFFLLKLKGDNSTRQQEQGPTLRKFTGHVWGLGKRSLTRADDTHLSYCRAAMTLSLTSTGHPDNLMRVAPSFVTSYTS